VYGDHGIESYMAALHAKDSNSKPITPRMHIIYQILFDRTLSEDNGKPPRTSWP